MSSKVFQEKSHFEPNSPPASLRGSRDGLKGKSKAEEPQSDKTAEPRIDNGASVDHVEEKPPPAVLNKKQKVMRHFKRFWLWYLIGTIIFLAIFLPILFKVIIPAIVQLLLNNQDLPVHGGSFQALSPTQVSLSLNISLDTPLPVTIDPILLYLYNKDTPTFSPFTNITLPEQHVNGNTDAILTNQTVIVTNETELIGWFNNVLDQPQVDLSVRGDPTVHLGALKSRPHLDKTISLPGLNKLDGLAIQDLQLVLPADKNGNNLKGTLNMPNWGVLTLGLGNLTLNLLLGDIKIGLITIYDLVLPPGNNTRLFSGEVYLKSILPNIGAILASQADALSNGNIQLYVTGNSTIVNGEHIKYIEAVLNKTRLPIPLSVIKLVSDVAGSLLGGGHASLVDIVNEIFGNSTLLENIVGHWNTTNIINNKTESATTTKMKRAGLRGSMAWNMLKLGMKMKLAKS